MEFLETSQMEGGAQGTRISCLCSRGSLGYWYIEAYANPDVGTSFGVEAPSKERNGLSDPARLTRIL